MFAEELTSEKKRSPGKGIMSTALQAVRSAFKPTPRKALRRLSQEESDTGSDGEEPADAKGDTSGSDGPLQYEAGGVTQGRARSRRS